MRNENESNSTRLRTITDSVCWSSHEVQRGSWKSSLIDEGSCRKSGSISPVFEDLCKDKRLSRWRTVHRTRGRMELHPTNGNRNLR